MIKENKYTLTQYETSDGETFVKYTDAEEHEERYPLENALWELMNKNGLVRRDEIPSRIVGFIIIHKKELKKILNEHL